MLLTLLFGAAVLLNLHRGIWFWSDDWNFLLDRQGNGLHQLFGQHNGHFVLLPVLLFKFNAALFGIGTMVPLHVISTALQLLVAALIYIFATRRTDPWVAYSVAVIVLFLGQGWENILWSFQVGFLLAMAAGLGALLLYELEGTRRTRVLTALLLTVSVASTGLGVIFLIGISVRAIWRDERKRAFTVLSMPSLVFAVWFLAVGREYRSGSSIEAAPQFASDLVAFAFGAVAGTDPYWGRAVALVALIAIATVIGRRDRITAAQAGLLALPVAFWVLTSIQRAGMSGPYPTRYAYVGALFFLLVSLEFLRDFHINTATRWCVIAFAAISVAGNFGHLIVGARYLRSHTGVTRAELTAIEASRSLGAARGAFDPTDPSFGAQHVPLYLDLVPAGGSSPAFSESELANGDEAARASADRALTQLELPSVTAAPPASATSNSAAPTVATLTGGTSIIDGSCVKFSPHGKAIVDMTLPQPGLVVLGTETVAVFSRRYSNGYQNMPVATIAAGRHLFSYPIDDSFAPWNIRLISTGVFQACSAP